MDPAFENSPIDISAIPVLGDDDFVPVHRNYLRVSLIGSFIFAVIVIAGCVVLSELVPETEWYPLAAMGVVLGLILIAVILRIFEVKNIAYQVRQHDLSHRYGMLNKTTETVPFVRVQHASVSQGPVERMFGLARLSVNSAGPDLNIAGLAFEDAERLRSIVVERAGALEQEK